MRESGTLSAGNIARVETHGGAGRVTQSSAINDDDAHEIDPRTTPPVLVDLLSRIEGEYREMPGLSLTLPQAERLWGLDRNTCEFVLTKLMERRFLRRAMNGTYVRGSAR
jgi:hypothetical protein